MESMQLLILENVVLNPILKLINPVTLGKSNISTIDNYVNNKNDDMITGIYGGAVYIKCFVKIF